MTFEEEIASMSRSRMKEREIQTTRNHINKRYTVDVRELSKEGFRRLSGVMEGDNERPSESTDSRVRPTGIRKRHG